MLQPYPVKTGSRFQEFSYEETDFVENCLAIVGDLIVACAKANPKRRTPEMNAHVVLEKIGHDRIGMLKNGMALCRCCREHKRRHSGIFARTRQQIEYIVPVDDAECKCMCSYYLDWLESLPITENDYSREKAPSTSLSPPSEETEPNK